MAMAWTRLNIDVRGRCSVPGLRCQPMVARRTRADLPDAGVSLAGSTIAMFDGVVDVDRQADPVAPLCIILDPLRYGRVHVEVLLQGVQRHRVVSDLVYLSLFCRAVGNFQRMLNVCPGRYTRLRLGSAGGISRGGDTT